MAASMNLTTRDEVKTYLGLTGTDDDDLIDALIAATSEAIETYCGREFASQTHTEYHDGRGAERLILDHRPVVSVTSLHDDPARNFADDSLINPDDYVVYEDAGIIEMCGVRSFFAPPGAFFSDALRNVKVVYVAGYDSAPSDVALACKLITAALYHRGKQGADGISSENHAGAYAATYAGELFTPEIRALLAHHREARL